MPSRKLCDHCPRCGEKNHLRARFCNHCGGRLDENRHNRTLTGNGHGHGGRMKLHADIAHPINAACRAAIERQVVEAYQRELERSKQPGYVPPNLDHEDMDYALDDAGARLAAASASLRLRPTGTASQSAHPV